MSLPNSQGNKGPQLLKIGEFARLAGTNLRTLRYYEELGLMTPASRSRGGFRYYRRTDNNRLRMIHHLQELGLQLEQIRDLMSTRDSLGDHSKFVASVRHALSEQDRLLQERIESLEEHRRNIKGALDKLQECEHCSHTPGLDNNYCEPCLNTGDPLPENVSALY